MEPIQVLLVEDDQDWSRGLISYLDREKDIHIVGQAMSGEEGIKIAQRNQVDVVLMDILLANSLNGIQATIEISQACDAKVIMLTSMEESSMVFESFNAGAVDYIVKSNFEEIPGAVRSAYHNRSPIHPCVADKIRQEFSRLKGVEKEYKTEQVKSMLTPTEIGILDLVEKGFTQREMAEELFVSVRTVKNHITNILRKMGEKSSKNVAKKAKEMGII